jgi:signal recognition particle receptor subunit beta
MALVNDAKKEINAKIVYLGPKGAGKATALRSIYSRLKPDCRSELKCMAAGEHQMLFFDFTYPLPRRSDGYTVRFHIYTLIAGNESTPPWKMLLKGADGIVLLADSTAGRMYGNLECCALLLDALGHYGLKLADTPLSLQCNKRDLKEAAPLAVMKNELLPELSEEPLPVTAITGEGLLEGLNRTIKSILLKLGEDGGSVTVADAAAAPAALPGEDYGVTGDDASLLHCAGAETGFAVETAGAPYTADSSTIVIPLRLTGGACGKSVDFTVTVSVTL